ncbi:hypothetical protein CRUP_020330, partial [Coryphaenoides rupestris]
FNDVILYTSRGMTSTNQFKVHGQLPLHGMTIRESEDEWGVPHAFTLIGQQQSVVVAASSLSEMERWMEDIKVAIDMTAESGDGPTADLLTSPVDNTKPFNKFPEDSSAEVESEDDTTAPRGSAEKLAAHRANTTVHVCWHRNTSVSMMDFSVAVEAENIHKDYVFKLHFKSHVYYFRSESEYTFERWMEVIRSATVPSSRTRIQNRKIESCPH